MNDPLLFLLAGLFLPLFPLSMVFNALLVGLPSRWLRALLILVWPQWGVLWVRSLEGVTPDWIPVLAVFTAALYALRLPAMRDVIRWLGLLATSLWALLWLAVEHPRLGAEHLHLYTLWFSLPLVGVALITGSLESRFGAAYAGLNMALASSLPRLSGVWVLPILAATATPLFPGFFVMINLLAAATPAKAIAVMVIWLLWSWAAARLIQGMIVGTRAPDVVTDLRRDTTWIYAMAMTGLVSAGLYWTRVPV